jgi:DNA-binding beta-propeller fold protein YncE
MAHCFTLRNIIKALPVSLLITTLACKHKPIEVKPGATGGFPDAISEVFIAKCATAGCHNAASYENAGGLLLDSWEHLFDGGNNGAVIVPYSVDYSPLLYFINTDSSMGPVAVPTMPLNHPPLSKEEYIRIRDWVANGAPDRNGNIPFADDAATRQKVYTIFQKCDLVAVIDAAKNVVMRYIPVGTKPFPESLTYIRTSPDGRYAYVCFWYSSDILKIDTHTDKVVAIYNAGYNFWGAMHISGDGQKIALTNGDNFELAVINTGTGAVQKFTNTGMAYPLGLAPNAAFDTFYITSQYGNTIYRVTAGETKKISIDGQSLTTTSGNTPDPYDIILSPDGSKYFVSCEKSNEIRVFDRSSDQLIKVIPVGKQPRVMTMARSKPYLFVPCMEDDAAAGFKGSVYIIDYNTLSVAGTITGKFYQPHTVSVDEAAGSVYIFSRNQNYDGPAPHHKGPCSGRNGYYNVYDLNTLQPKDDKRSEILVDPYISATRFAY